VLDNARAKVLLITRGRKKKKERKKKKKKKKTATNTSNGCEVSGQMKRDWDLQINIKHIFKLNATKYLVFKFQVISRLFFFSFSFFLSSLDSSFREITQTD